MGHFTSYMKSLPSLRNRTPDLLLTPAGISDAFTGEDDDPPDSSKWVVNGTPVIESNMLRWYLPGGEGTNFHQLIGKWQLSGDFDCYIPFTGSAFQNLTHSALTLYAYSTESAKYWYIQIYLTYPTSTRAYIGTWAGDGASYHYCGRDDVAVRVTRESDEINLWFANTSVEPFTWTKHNFSPIAGSDSDEKIRLQIYVQNTNDYPWLDYSSDFFTCASADLIEAV